MSRIIVALDAMTRAEALALAEILSGAVWGVKVNDLLLEYGLSVVSELKKHCRVFADPKLHDIPNTVKNGVTRLCNAGADLITLHASGGEEMIRSAVAAASGGSKILTVTALTSLGESDTAAIYQRSPGETVLSLAKLAARAGAHGIVCSPLELPLLGAESELLQLTKIVPGIRPTWHSKADDQVRTSTPRGAVEGGATLLVIGRPITEADAPLVAAQKINDELSGLP